MSEKGNNKIVDAINSNTNKTLLMLIILIIVMAIGFAKQEEQNEEIIAAIKALQPQQVDPNDIPSEEKPILTSSDMFK